MHFWSLIFRSWNVCVACIFTAKMSISCQKPEYSRGGVPYIYIYTHTPRRPLPTPHAPKTRGARSSTASRTGAVSGSLRSQRCSSPWTSRKTLWTTGSIGPTKKEEEKKERKKGTHKKIEYGRVTVCVCVYIIADPERKQKK